MSLQMAMSALVIRWILFCFPTLFKNLIPRFQKWRKKTEEERGRRDLEMKNGDVKGKGNIKKEQEKKKKVRESGTQQNESEEQK